MASSEIDVCNLALSRLGDRATVASINPPEGSAQADHCARFYPLARDIAVAAHAWGFATVRSTVPAVLANPQPGYAYAYAVPSDCLRVIRVMPTVEAYSWWDTLEDTYPYTREADELSGAEIILSNVAGATIVYLRRVTDTNLFPPLFVSALAWLLASYLAGPVVKGDGGRKAGQACYVAWENERKQAAGLDANQTKRPRRHVPDSIRARNGYASGYAITPDAPIIGTYGWYAYPTWPGYNG